MSIIKTINIIIAIIFFICYVYQFVYVAVVWTRKNKRKYCKGDYHKFACLICARNEAKVIGDLLDSISTQIYPSEYLTVFVMADNCTDSTADVARSHGAIVYERQNKDLVGKGYALDALMKKIESEHGDIFDGYLVFDADNVLDPHFVDEMNNTFSSGFDIVTSFRNSKNYGDNWISAGYALWYLRESRYLSHARSLLNTSCAVSGTGFLFSRRIKSKYGGWPFHLLTEDIEFSVCNILDGEKIGFAPNAELYDEQPISFRQSWRQRMRWCRGYYQVFRKYGKELLKGMLSRNFSCYDMTMTIMPAAILSFLTLLSNSILGIFILINNGTGIELLEVVLKMFLGGYQTLFFFGLITTITEWKKINLGWFKKIVYVFTFPIFMYTYIPISFAALFKKVTWKPIEHHGSRSNLQMRNKEKTTRATDGK